ncbi:peptidylprolyl isomerase [Frigidibacter oleivorans]|uniref:peptidylprolyl isomerase n=1 Tax=Frigidibacter oleivorans TaxID=2487129 RepID=UPI0013E04DD3|nr:peptidylprolyl isomerase [Frigidibacter oleivorans]
MRRCPSLPALAVAALAACGSPVLATVAAAQDLSPQVIVNGRAITAFEIQQRQLFLTLLNAPPEMLAGVEEALIEDRLRQAEAARVGLSINEQEVRAAMEEFAGRANLTAEQFTGELAKAGVSAETFRDFVATGVIWRTLVRARFNAQGNRVTDLEVDRAVAEFEFGEDMPSGPRVLISEIVIRRDDDARARLLAERVATVATTPASFDTAARQYSTSGTRDEGGELDWMALESLPPEVRGTVNALQPGQISAPVRVGDGVYAMFLMRERAAQPAQTPEGVDALDYAQLLVSGPAEAEKLRGQVDTCNDLYDAAQRMPAGALTRTSQPETALPADIRAELSRLDAGEVSTGLRRGEATVFLMLCARGRLLDTTTVPRTQVRARLENGRLVQFADSYMAELRAEADIRYP